MTAPPHMDRCDRRVFEGNGKIFQKYRRKMVCVEAPCWRKNHTTFINEGQPKRGPQYQQSGSGDICCAPPQLMTVDGGLTSYFDKGEKHHRRRMGKEGKIEIFHSSDTTLEVYSLDWTTHSYPINCLCPTSHGRTTNRRTRNCNQRILSFTNFCVTYILTTQNKPSG